MRVMIVKVRNLVSSDFQLKPIAITFFGGTLLSSIGSFAFTTGAMSFMVKAGYPLTYVGYWVGLSRLMGVVSGLLFGDSTDRFPARKFLILTEILALVISIGLLLLWQGGSSTFFGFFVLSLVRAAVLPLQQGARSKISKSIAGQEFAKNLKTAIWLNKATQGATVFSALICLYAIKALTFEWLIIFDGLTFLLSTLLLLALPDFITSSQVSATPVSSISVFSKLKYLYQFNRKAATLDFLLSLVFTGVNLTVVRLAGSQKEMIPLLVAVGGVCLWLAGPIAAHRNFEKFHGALWLLFGLSWATFGVGSGHWSFALLLIPFVLQRLSFFALNHRYSGMIQHDTPHEKLGSVVNARLFQSTALLSLGDLAVGVAGSLGGSIPLSVDAIWRVIICFAVAGILIMEIEPNRWKNLKKKGVSTAMSIILASGVGLFSQNSHANSPLMLRVPMRSLKLNLDPQSMKDAYSMVVNVQIYRGLFRFNSDSEIEPDLVETWKVSSDHKEYRFKLRERRFSDGSSITAENVRQTFARIFFIGAAMGSDLNYISGVSKFRKSHRLSDLGIVPVSSHEIVFKLQNPSPLFLKHLAVADCGILAIKDFREQLPARPISSGPFQIINQSPVDIVLSLRSDGYFPLSSNPPGTVRFLEADDSKAIEWAKKGDVDTVDSISSLSVEEIGYLLQHGWYRTVTNICTQHYVLMNPSLYSSEIREYLAMSINRENLLKELAVEGLSAAYGFVPNGLAGSITHNGMVKPTTTKKHPPKGEIQLQYIEGDPFEKGIAEGLARQWSHGSFKVNLEPVPISDFLKLIGNKAGKIALGRKGIDYPDGFAMISYFRTGFQGNHYFAGSPETDSKIDQLAGVYDSQERARLYREIQIELMKSHTFLPIFFGTKMAGLWNQRVRFVPSHPMGLHMLNLESVEMK